MLGAVASGFRVSPWALNWCMVPALVIILASIALAVLPLYLGVPMAILTAAVLSRWLWRERLREADRLRDHDSAFQSGRAPLTGLGELGTHSSNMPL